MFNWWTFAFSIVNFLIVLYILYRLLFKPIKKVINERDEIINKRFEIATKKEKEALKLKEEYEKELKEIKILKQKIINEANAQAFKIREKILEEAKNEAKEILEKEKKIVQEEKQKIYKFIIEKSKEFSQKFSIELLEHIIDKDFNELIVKKFIKNFDKEFADILKKIEKPNECKVQIYLANSVSEETLKDIDKLLDIFKCQKIEKEIKIDKELIGGIKIRVNENLFDGSIRSIIEKAKESIEQKI